MPIAAFSAFLLSHLRANRLVLELQYPQGCRRLPTSHLQRRPRPHASAPTSPLTTSSTFSRHALFSPHAPLCRPLKFQFIQRIRAVARAE
ncbi:hypothetical protein B0H13DRAFT_2083318 [Mycena leptocephala]|nr:hypothetical protein B0H13DRAFT_2083318 [Mycena leptocephala]